QQRLSRRVFASTLAGALALPGASSAQMPNVVVILADDLGFGDLGCFGSAIPTPNLNRMAEQGLKSTRFYSASPVCSPSRAALLTGRYPVHSGVVGVLMPDADGGLKETEPTIAKLLKARGYRTACVGKWHLGTKPDCTPNRNGFDEFYGIPYSNDMQPLPFIADADVEELAAKPGVLIEQFTRKAVNFIARSRNRPFFLFLAHTAPHIPLVPSEKWKGKSGCGTYGDVVAEMDWGVGQVLEALKTNGLDENTLVIFTSDNGPWYQGSAGNLQGRKGSTYEGGVREPFIARFPGRIPAGQTSTALASMMDLMPTIAAVCGAQPPVTNGVDLWPVLTGKVPFIDREPILFFDGYEIQCVRWGPWKLHLSRYNSVAWTQDPPGGRQNLPLPNPELYHIDTDPAEAYDRSSERPDIVRDLIARVEREMVTLPDVVGACWRETMRKRVQATPVGALPRTEGH
ncbi:MAG TPA: sulfatase, partial [Bryobacteraceae bacterium]|nr:sulfatase [Bryobacteraceae bacterium]